MENRPRTERNPSPAEAAAARRTARIRAEYIAGDELLILLAGKAARRDPVTGWDHLTAAQQAATVAAMTDAATQVLRWRTLPMREPATRASFAVTDAVAAAHLRDVAP